jgi:hypothetical protein
VLPTDRLGVDGAGTPLRSRQTQFMSELTIHAAQLTALEGDHALCKT